MPLATACSSSQWISGSTARAEHAKAFSSQAYTKLVQTMKTREGDLACGSKPYTDLSEFIGKGRNEYIKIK